MQPNLQRLGKMPVCVCFSAAKVLRAQNQNKTLSISHHDKLIYYTPWVNQTISRLETAAKPASRVYDLV